MLRRYSIPIALLGLLTALAACGTSPPSRYYALESAGFDGTTDATDSVVLAEKTGSF